MDFRVGVAKRMQLALETVPSDHAEVRRRYLQKKWANSPSEDDFDAQEGG